MKKNMSLKTKITLLIALIISLVSILLTTISIRNADTYFISVSEATDDGSNVARYGEVSTYDTIINADSEKTEENLYHGFKEDTGDGRIISEGVVTEVSNKFANESIMYMLIIIVLGIVTAYLLLSKSLKPLKDLDKAIENINENNLSSKITNIKINDEVGNLANSFNIMLDKLNKSFTNQKQFTSNAAHELKTPLAIMKSSIDVLKMDKEPSIEDYKESLRYMEQSAKNLIKIVDDLLKLTSSANGCFDEVVFIDEIIDKVVEQLDVLVKERNININIERNKYKVVGNESLLYHVFFNIIENAIKYNVYGGSININILKEKDKTKIIISDSGIGMENEEIENIFEPFYCIDKSRTEENGGYGLGLSIVKSIIEKQNGEIYVTSEINKGTTFTIIL